MDKRFSQQTNADVRELDFSQPVINIGSHSDNDVVLTGAGILPFHATLIAQDGKFQLIALGSPATIRLEGAPLESSPALVAPSQRVGIGQHTMLCTPANGGLNIKVMRTESATSQPQPAAYQGDAPIVVNVLGQLTEVDVKQSAYYDLEIINAGQIVAVFDISVSDVPKEWVEITPQVVNLFEGQRATVRVSITPPQEPTSSAGKRLIKVSVQSPNYGGYKVSKSLPLTIRPYYDFAVASLDPRQQHISWRKKSGVTHLPITNNGNSPADFSVTAVDDENGCTFDFEVDQNTQLSRQANITVPAGGTTTLPIEITPLKQPMIALRSRRYHYTTTIQLIQQARVPQTLSGTVTSHPLIGWWSIVLTALLLLLGIFFLIQPVIYNFGVATGKDVIEKGDTTRLEWKVSPFATRLNISGIEQTIKYGQTSLTIAPTQSTTYELISGNWLSGLLGLDRKETVTVLVVPPTPNINVFEVDSTTVAQGVPVTIRWSVTKSDQAFLTIDEVVYELKPDQFSGEQTVTLPKDALVTLEAKNATGSALRSYYINVVPPNITVNTFTVWVRSQATTSLEPAPVAGAGLGGGKMLALAEEPPDPNFPQKYVELIPDKSSDSGYRVEFELENYELSKGEQIMLVWDIEGVDNDKVQIAPFTEPLPAKGAQPFFPQESMNFVMTAKSGDLEKLFMLPVKVFDGEPPVAPKIEFFRASPVKATGATDVQFAWSVSGEWTRVQLATEGKVIADYLTPQGFKTIRVEKSTTYILTAYNGTLSSAAPVEITIDPALKPIGLYFKLAQPPSGRFQINSTVDFTIAFYDPEKSDLKVNPPVYEEPEVAPTGDVTVTDGVSTCPIELPQKTCTLKFTTPGDPKEVIASYEGDKVYLSATSEPYGDDVNQIVVVTSKVTLTPTYYLLNRTTPADSTKSSPISVNTSPLSLDTGLYIEVRVTPQGAPLPTPPGKVDMYLCEQRPKGTGFEIVPGSCDPRGFASITMNGTIGYAYIQLDSFPEAGTFAFLFSYTATGFDPATRPEFGVVVDPVDVYLSMASCTTPKTFSGCEIGTSDPKATRVYFDIRKVDDDQKINADLATPPIEAFRVYEVIGGIETDWDSCRIATVTEDGTNYHKLECTVDFSSGSSVRSPAFVNFVFDATKGGNYAMPGTTPLASNFELKIKRNTLISLESSDFLNLKVGQWVQLTSSSTTDTSNPDGAIILTDTGFQHITPNGSITVTAEEENAFGIEPSVSDINNCTLDATGKVLTIASITTNCAIYFKNATTSPYHLSVTFNGDVNFYLSNSSSPLAVSVAKQDGVTLSWQYKLSTSAAYQDWTTLSSVEPNATLYIRVILNGPTGFSAGSFAGNTLGINMQLTANTNNGTCKLSGVSGSNPNYTAIIDTSTSTSYTDFSLRCDNEPITVSLTASLPNANDFAIATDQITQRVLGILNRGNRYMNIEFYRVNGDVKTSMLNNLSLNELHIGEKYTLNAAVGPLWADAWYFYHYEYAWWDWARLYPILKTDSLSPFIPRQSVINKYLNDKLPITITMDPDLYNRINWSKSTASCKGSAANTLQIVMTNYRVLYDFGVSDMNRWPDNSRLNSDIELYNPTPCVLYFDNSPITTVTGTNDQTTFLFETRNPNDFVQIFSAGKNFNSPNPLLDKQTVTISSSTASYNAYLDSASSTITIDLASEITGSANPPLDTTQGFLDLFSISDPCTNLVTGSITSATRATLTLTPTAISGNCSGSLSVSYKANNWFQANTSLPAISINVIKHTPAVQTIEYQQGTWRNLEPTYPTWKIGDSIPMRVRVQNGDTPVNSTLIPGGSVEVWIENTAATPVVQGTDIYTIPLDSGITYDSTRKVYTISLNSSGQALFTLNIVKNTTGLNIKYKYLGSTLYSASSTLTAGPIDFAP